MNNTVLNQILAIAKKSGVDLPPLQSITPDTPLAELNLDSTDFLTIVFELEDFFGITLQNYEGELITLGDLIQAVSGRMG
ncbi:MAG: acyl carrier protein [Magnetococcales bacterium]|nr:acyl carrier protein [Magnetococcales bacterium]